ncbi:1-deoxy-D-xylulose-5-phosphate reductoisomerase [Aceticella autotrophica]|uniref:1-deoxy-D-xylulose 5-phosphate reductoisomerase n=1 Tax=Aceticella autotrophica TaxID=2755338 RepID=A0A975AXF3_9THEO|nr:1-deoxy-D-xylulose-5-phosphate reductoisomerase [Aceticella autotrophica]QSZ28246.1 1-deoxy-D-xylulose-5-phosphate reductoisomerase [Aceticella autotrophica]
MKNIVILGSTGSIGTQTLDVIRNSKDFNVLGLTCNNNLDLLIKQIDEFKPKVIAVKDENNAKELKNILNNTGVEILSGEKGICDVAEYHDAELVVVAIEGIAGLMPAYKAIKAKKNIMLANKECLVTGGKIITELAKKNKVKILPIDSEHNAIFQCLQGNEKKYISKLIITASGGPFRGKTKEELKFVTMEQALKHPNWKMGKKITIDSATLMNKGFEVIEAKWLFDVPLNKIEVLVHPQSIIHSMVEYIDGCIIAEMATTDMRIPIQYALNYPERKAVKGVKSLDFEVFNTLTFEKPDLETFKCLSLAYQAIEEGGTMTTVLNTADEVAVSLFLEKRIKFLDIPKIIEKSMEKHDNIINPDINDIIEVDHSIRKSILDEYMR